MVIKVRGRDRRPR